MGHTAGWGTAPPPARPMGLAVSFSVLFNPNLRYYRCPTAASALGSSPGAPGASRMPAARVGMIPGLSTHRNNLPAQTSPSSA